MKDGLAFNAKELDRFWRFVNERHSIWHRRFVLGLPGEEWTKDPILKKNKFTNIYRELDPGTRFAIEEIMSVDPYSDPRYIHLADGPDLRPDKVFNVMMYRLMCSIPTYSNLGFQTLKEFDQDELEHYLGQIYKTGEPVFGNAYLISPYSSMGSEYKYVNVARLFGRLHQNFAKFFKRLDEAPSFEKAFKVVNSQYGFGPFLAYQVMVDLTYPLPNTKYKSAIIPFSQDDWAKLGPGALRGFRRLSRYADGLSGLICLRDHQRSEFARLDLDFPFLRSPSGEEVDLTLANLQNCLCEFHKYRSIMDGVGKSQRLFVPSTEHLRLGGTTTGRISFENPPVSGGSR